MSSEVVENVAAQSGVAESPAAKVTNPYLARFSSYIPASVTTLAELTPRAVIVGTLLGMVFGASSLYLVLKVGLTVSASIPVAVISITLFRIFSTMGGKNSTILENNIVQTSGSAGESIAFGVGVTMPAIMILGFDLEVTRAILVSVLGGLLGILMMIPLRRALIVQQHGYLKYPEGTACAEVLKAGASDDSKAMASEQAKAEAAKAGEANIGAKTIFVGFGLGFVYQVISRVFYGWKEIPGKVFGAPFKAGSVGAEINPALLGVGYIIGPRIASIMCAGGALAYLVLIPAIKFFGDGLTTVLPPGDKLISEMGPGEIRGAYVLYIGAGAVTAGGIISLVRSLPTIWHGLKGGLADLRGGQAANGNNQRTDIDLPMKFVLIGIVALMTMIVLFPQLGLHIKTPVVAILGATMIIAFGFLFVTVSSRLTGEIGSSSNPISGMTVATLLFTCLIFFLVGWRGSPYFVTALSIGAIVCIAASNGGTTSQDLKTGFLVGGTPKLQQIAILCGALASALILGPILIGLNNASTVYAPQITFAPLKENAKQVDAARANALPAYTEQFKPSGATGDFRLLTLANDKEIEGLNKGEYLVDQTGKATHKVERNFAAGLKTDPTKLTEKETIQGPQKTTDSKEYLVWRKTDEASGNVIKYFVDGTGAVKYIVDPGINGSNHYRPDGSEVSKFDAPKATLMSYIIKGVLDQKLPWALVLLGVMIAIVLEMSGIPSLAFAVGVYLPISSSSPIFIGGLVRWLVDHLYLRKKLEQKYEGKLSEEEFNAEADKSPGVLLASGYIAGGAIAGIVIAFMASMLADTTRGFEKWAEHNNPLYAGAYSDALSMIPFLLLTVFLYLVGRDALLTTKNNNNAKR
jgi:putative OPT family oligopeptide transporter